MKRLGLMTIVLLLLGVARVYAAESAFFISSSTVSLAVTGTTARVAIALSEYNPNVRLYNSGSVAVFIVCGDITVVATVAAGMPVAPGTVEVISCAPTTTYVAGISAGTASTLYLTAGNGI